VAGGFCGSADAFDSCIGEWGLCAWMRGAGTGG